MPTTRILYGVVSPDVPDGEYKVLGAPGGPNAKWWGWSWLTRSLPPSGSALRITEASGSGAMRVFDYLRYAQSITTSALGESGRSLVVWLRMNTSWSCGACAGLYPTSVLGQNFDMQMWVSPA
jgi:hypothetical protein